MEHYRRDAEEYQYRQPEESAAGQIERRRAEIIRRSLDRSTLDGGLVLDIGSGGGTLLCELARAGALPAGLDIPILNLKKIRDRFQENNQGKPLLVSGDACRLPFLDNSIDALVFSEILEHLNEPEKAIKEASRVLKPGGRMIISVPYRERIIHHLCIHCNKPTPANAHLHSFDKTSFHKMLSDLPLKIEKEICYHNKLLCLLDAPRRMRAFPYFIWRFLDSFANFFIRKQHFLLLSVRKKGSE